MKKSGVLICVMGLVFLIGLTIFLYPAIYAGLCKNREEKQMAAFTERKKTVATEEQDSFLAAMEAYNRQLAETGQQALTSLTVCADFALDPTDYDRDEMVGYVEIPVMLLRLPLYLGASDTHMEQGAAVMGETSAPVGGESTNCVIAGHRGWRGADKFRYIDKLAAGDRVFVTNYWDTLVYEVREIRIIEPDDVSAVMIVPGKDQITLLTCHPYASGGRYRYLVICQRVES